MCSRNDTRGEAACATACAPSTRKRRSGTRASLQLREELPKAPPDLLAAGEPAPAAPEDAHQAIALVDGNEIVLASGADAVHQERLYVRLQLQGIEARDLLPGFKRDQRLRRARRPGVERRHTGSGAQEEGEPDGESQRIPLGVTELEVREQLGARSDAEQARSIGKQPRASTAGALQLVACRIDLVVVPRAYRRGAQLAALHGRRLLAHEPPERRDDVHAPTRSCTTGPTASISTAAASGAAAHNASPSILRASSARAPCTRARTTPSSTDNSSARTPAAPNPARALSIAARARSSRPRGCRSWSARSADTRPSPTAASRSGAPPSSSMRPPSRPVKPTVSMPSSRADASARLTLALLPLVEMPSAMSPFRASTWSCSTKVMEKSRSFPFAVMSAVSQGSAMAGSGDRFSKMGCMNSTETCCASQALPPLPKTNSLPSRANASFIAEAQASMRAAFSLKNASLRWQLSRALRKMAACSAFIGAPSSTARRRSTRRRRLPPKPWWPRAEYPACTACRRRGSRAAS